MRVPPLPGPHFASPFSIGVLAGAAAAAAVYAFHCDETAPAFVATWYSAGMLLPAIVGAMVGPRVLRW